MRRTLIVCLLALTVAPLSGQSGTKNGEWRSYAGDPGSTKYSPLDQINKDNAKTLRIAWRFKTDNLGVRPDYNMQVTPLVVNGVMYAQAGTRRAVVAINPATGELLWMWRMDEGKRGEVAPRQGSGRGVAYWTDGKGDERVLTITPGYHLVALNAKTGIPVASFGRGGIVDLKTELDQPGLDLITSDIGINAAPAVGNNVVVVGAAHTPGGAPRTKENVKGYVRGYDVRTGKRLWIFHTIPQPGEAGNETWENDSWSYTGNAGNWASITIDEEANRVYLATEGATGDYYGGHRPGANLFTDSIVSLDLNTGKRYWYFQAIHHDIWDWDFPTAPILMDLNVSGKPIKAVGVISKQGWIYTFDRMSGEPVWPIVEKPVEKGTVPGEWYSPTQPFPTRPAPFDRQGVSEADLIDWTPEIKAEALRIVGLHKIGPIFTPPIVPGEGGKAGMLMLPAATGGANWEGGCFDPETGIVYVFSTTAVTRLSLINDPARSNMNFIQGGGGGEGGGGAAAPAPAAAPAGGRAPLPPITVFGLPLVKPPYGRITAINMNTGDHVWMQPVGDTPDAIKNHEKLKGVTIPKTGRSGRLGTMLTKTLLWAGERGPLVTVDGQQGSWLRSYDKATGEIVSEHLLPANTTGVPMTYMVNTKQYIVVAVGAAGRPSEFVALALP
ncbi:MAG: pyrroloquinoline quinone-dependent dehydrogenase [Acidobacteria bacterium]|nr:pyrroloquinoline quinone-dependent dehydrogenase [Acidobacteriota bacterium]